MTVLQKELLVIVTLVYEDAVVTKLFFGDYIYIADIEGIEEANFHGIEIFKKN